MPNFLNKLLEGKAPERFSPDTPLTREQLATILQNIFQFQASGQTSSFQDVPPSYWAFKAVQAMKQQGIMNGYEDRTFKPLNTSTRAQMAALMSSWPLLLREKDKSIRTEVNSLSDT